MTMQALLAMARDEGLTVTVRVKPLNDGYTVLIQAGYIGGARPMFERSFSHDHPRGAAIDEMARYPLDFFNPNKANGVRPLNV